MSRTVSLRVGRGTMVTLPVWLRAKYRLDRGSRLTLVDLDGVVLLRPGPLAVPGIAAEMTRERRARGLSLKDLGGPRRQD